MINIESSANSVEFRVARSNKAWYITRENDELIQRAMVGENSASSFASVLDISHCNWPLDLSSSIQVLRETAMGIMETRRSRYWWGGGINAHYHELHLRFTGHALILWNSLPNLRTWVWTEVAPLNLAAYTSDRYHQPPNVPMIYPLIRWTIYWLSYAHLSAGQSRISQDWIQFNDRSILRF